MAGGRQREFCKLEALEKAMLVFWKKGFVGASLTDLTKSMGINKPSMYAAFGNKEQLFILSTEHYLENHASKHTKFLYLENMSLKKRLKAYLMSALASQCNETGPKGCYISLCVTESAGDGLPLDAYNTIEKTKDQAEELLTDFFTDEQNKNNLSNTTKPNELARYIVTVLHGLAAMARGNKSILELEPVVDLTLLKFD